MMEKLVRFIDWLKQNEKRVSEFIGGLIFGLWIGILAGMFLFR